MPIDTCSKCSVVAVLIALAWPAHSEPTRFYVDRSAFLLAVGASLTDEYTGYGSVPGSSVILSDSEMSAVLDETRYEALTHSNLNLAGDIYRFGDGTNYCSGCNGSFRLHFDDTSYVRGRGLFGVAVDIVLCTARRNAIGDDVPGDAIRSGVVTIEFTNGFQQQIEIPADVGFFGPQTFFLGITDPRGIHSMTFGAGPVDQTRWVIDNLTIASRPRVPEPGPPAPR